LNYEDEELERFPRLLLWLLERKCMSGYGD
jgi:hypothetical protein